MKPLPVFAAVLVFTGCASGGTQDASRTLPDAKVPYAAKLAVIGFRDCLLQTEASCDHSGARVTPLITSGLDDPPGLHAFMVGRPVGQKDELSDADAVAYGKRSGYDYVINGTVSDYHVPDSIIRDGHRGHVSLHVLRTSDGELLDAYRCDINFGVVGSLNSSFEGVGGDVRHELVGNASWMRHALFGQPCDGPRHPEEK